MNRKALKSALCFFIALIILIGVFPVSAEQNTKTVYEAQDFIDGIVDYKLKSAGVTSIEQWINGEITQKAGNTDWYAITLSQYGSFDFSDYEKALVNYLANNKVASASSRQKYALALISIGSTSPYIYNTLNDSIGKQGVMSWIFGLHLLNNGYTSNEYSISAVTEKLLSLQKSDGGWAVTGSYGDVDTTAMAVQALSPYYNSDTNVKAAVDKALALLSERQNSGGDYSSYGVANAESTAQVIAALASLGIDCKNDSRFIKNGNTLFDGITLYRLSDGSFCHKQGGTVNDTATVQVFYSMVSYLRMQNGKSAFYLLDQRNPDGLKNTENSTHTEAEQSSTEAASGVISTPTTPPLESSTTAEMPQSSISTNTVTENSITEPTDDPTVSEQTDTSSSTANDTSSSTENNKSNYRLWISLAIIIAAVVICLLMYIFKKRNIKNLILIAVVSVIAVILVFITDFSSVNEHYGNIASKENVVGTVWISIRCDTIPDKSAEHIPDSGIILDTTEFEIEDGDTVYDILLEATATNKIHLETNGSNESIYIEGISNIYEFDFGELSGWVYHINGKSAEVSCSEYKLFPGDKIEWLYTCDMGKDVE